MSTAPPPAPAPAPHPAAPPERDEIKIVSHSMLFYWWPVWLVGFILAGLTYFWNPHYAITVPAKTEIYYDASVKADMPDGRTIEFPKAEVIVLPKYTEAQIKNPDYRHLPKGKEGRPEQPHLYIASTPTFGVLFVTVLILVIFITNVPLRGMWSMMVIMLAVLLSIILGLADLWTPILKALSLLDIRINMGGYMFISIILFAIWILSLIVFDPRVYIVFTPGQFKVCTEIGGGEKVFDVVGMKMEKQRSNLFLHWFLGLGSGDLIVRTAGAATEHFDLQNVLFIGRKVKLIEEMLQKRKVTESK
jgi:hypothetical protein